MALSFATQKAPHGERCENGDLREVLKKTSGSDEFLFDSVLASVSGVIAEANQASMQVMPSGYVKDEFSGSGR